MLASEALAAREALGMSAEDFAADHGLTPHVVAAWESGSIKVPRQIAVDLTWRLAAAAQQAGLRASGLPECQSIAALDRELPRQTLKQQTARIERLSAHVKSCEVCLARDAFLEANFPPMPPAPLPAWMIAAGWVGKRVERLPPWARPAAVGAMAFASYGLLRIIFDVRAIIAAPRAGIIAAGEGLLIDLSLGAGLGLLYGVYRMIRDRRSS